MKRWNALAGATLVAALVLAPMASMGAYAADEIEGAPPEAIVALDVSEPESVAGDPGDGLTDTEEADTGETAEAEAGATDTAETDTGEGDPSDADTPDLDQPVTFGVASNDDDDDEVPFESKWVFVCKYVGTPGVDERLQSPGQNPISVSVSSIQNWDGVTIPSPLFADGHTRSAVIAWDPEKGEGQNNEPSLDLCPPPDGPPVLVIPDIPGIDDPCGTDEDGYELPANTAEVEYSYIEGSIVAHRLYGDGWGELPDGWVDNEDGGTATWVGNEGDFTDRPCPYPVPTVFNADPEPATCDAAGSFSTAFLGDREPIDEGDGWAVYEFENVYIEVNRTVDGEVTLYIWAKDGFFLTDTEGWSEFENEVDHYYYRTILIPEQLSDPEVCPLVVVPAPPAPTFTDACGTANDVLTVPADTEEYFYEVNEDGDTTFIEVFPAVEGDTFPEGTVTEWTFVATDVPCPTPTPAALPATGGVDMMPWGIGGAALLLAGAAALSLQRRLARR